MRRKTTRENGIALPLNRTDRLPMTQPAKAHDCWFVFDPGGSPKHYTCRPAREHAIAVHETATKTLWMESLKDGYTVRKQRMTEVK